MAFKKTYASLYERLVSNTAEPANSCDCWTWTGKNISGRYPHVYPRMNIRFGGKHLSVRVHRAILVLIELEGEEELFFPLYNLYSISGFEADHLCTGNPMCVNPDHLQWLDKESHRKRTNAARYGC